MLYEVITDGWITDYQQIAKLKPFAEDKNFLSDFSTIKNENKLGAAAFLQKDSNLIINTNSFFDVQVKRIHEYKRQLLNALNILLIYNDLKAGGDATKNMESTTFLFGRITSYNVCYTKLLRSILV